MNKSLIGTLVAIWLLIAICKAAPNDSEDFNLNKNMVPDDLDLNLKEIYQPEDRYYYPKYFLTDCLKGCKEGNRHQPFQSRVDIEHWLKANTA